MHTLWAQTCQIGERTPLRQNIQTEVAVIGAGLAGVLTGFMLQEAGKEVVIIEANRIASGQSGRTTAKITSQHGLIYQALWQRFGFQKARQYAGAQQQAIEKYSQLIEQYQIDCDFQRQNAYIYSQNLSRLKRELHAALRLNLPAKIIKEPALPFRCAGALCFENQACFNPLPFIQSLSKHLTIYEHTKALSVDGHRIYTTGGTIDAKQIVFACHYPFINIPGFFFARMYQKRSYVLALENAPFPEGMWIGDGPSGYSFRHYGPYLLFGGEGHRTGEHTSSGHYRALRKQASLWFPGSREAFHWSAQDCVSIDRVPYIGRISSSHPDWFVATGFQKWGMTNAMVSALLLRDLICQGKSPLASVFEPRRFSLQDLPPIAALGGGAAFSIGKRLLQRPRLTAAQIAPGHGGIVLIDGEKCGVYKDARGEIFVVQLRCPHLGCQLQWNPDELTWDCPCHGSRYDYRGLLLHGPAQKDTIL